MLRCPALAREILRLLATLLVAFAVVTGIALFLEALGAGDPVRAARKLLVPVFIGLYLLATRPHRGSLARELGLRPSRGALGHIDRGLLAGAGSLLLLNLVLLALGARRFELEPAPALFLLMVPVWLGQALIGGVLEETLFRGLMFGRLQRSGGAVAAVVVGSAIFAAAHFLRPGGETAALPAWKLAPACLAGVPEAFAARPDELFGLALVGIVLAILRLRSGTIHLALGVHAGWVFVRKLADKALEEVDAVADRLDWLVGSKRVYDGMLGWIAHSASLLLVRALAPRAEEPAARGREAAPEGAGPKPRLS